MTRRNLSTVVRYLQQLTGSARASGASDAELLERYVRHRDEAAFELLLWRHGTLVFNVCRRILPCQQDAEDAFQATFLAFVRKAGSISRRGSVAGWLYKVAYRVALEAGERARKIAVVEKSGGERLAVVSVADPLWSDVRPILDDEVNRLPERLRRPIVLCYLEGKSNAEAAEELGCRLGTLYSRLARGREMLRRRLLRRGVTLSVAGLTAALTTGAAEAAPAIHLMRTTVQAALSFAESSAAAAISPRVAALAEGVLRTMFVTKLKIAAVMLSVATVLAAGGVLSHGLTAASPPEAKAKEPPPKAKDDDKKDAKPIPVKVVKPKKGGETLTSTWSAEVVAAQQQQLGALVSGTVKEVLVDIGDHVKKGQTLIVLDAPLLATAVEEAQASLEIAQAQVVEAKAVLDEEELKERAGQGRNQRKARASWSAAKAKAKLAQALLDKARIQESFTQLKAAFDGVVTRRTIDPGNYVQPSDSRLLRPLLTIQRLDTMRISFQVSPQDVPLIKRGRPVLVEIHLPGLRGREYKISRFSAALEGNDRRFREMTVEIDVPNADNRLLPGMTGQVKIHDQPPPDTLVVPTSSVFGTRDDEADVEPYLWTVRDGKAHRTPVAVRVADEKNAEIIKGIAASDLIAVSNQGELKEGKPVKVELIKDWGSPSRR
ncbi:MAG TPA: efflux RND transporter periplasmic adaptor subunit [Gemmataceae bacterium]|nr:efflux RND transporter periplasmic adaptor subunit [Gemmataceae bacterium]